MTLFAICVLLFVANLLVYQDAAILLPVTGALVLGSVVRLYLLRRIRSLKAARTGSSMSRGGQALKAKSRSAPMAGGTVAARDLGQRAAESLGPRQRQEKKSGRKRESEQTIAVQRQGNVLYATFPSTKEGRRRALEVFSKEKPGSPGQDGQPLQ